MDARRRDVLKTGGGATLLAALAAVGWLKPGEALAQAPAWNKAAFEAKTIDEALKALGSAGPAQSKDIAFVSTPDIAENGAVVPVGIKSNLPKTQMMALLVEKNPNALAGAYDILEGTDPEVSMRIKMGQSSDVVALVKADGKFYMAKKEVKVTIGGCGG